MSSSYFGNYRQEEHCVPWEVW